MPRFLLQEILDAVLADSGPEIEFVIPGRPEGKGRPRFSKGHVYTPANSLEYERNVRLWFIQTKGRRDWPKDARAYFVWVKLCYEKGKGKGHHPDPDNVVKAIQDGLTGTAWNDDSHVFTWPAPGDEKSSRCVVRIKALEGR